MTGDPLLTQLKELPAFRGLLRAVEARFYVEGSPISRQALPLPRPVLDVGCGDGHFASVTFADALDAGLDPCWGPLTEARGRHAYRVLAQADGTQMPYADSTFSSAISNSVLEHIPDAEAVLVETSRVLRRGAPFYFCVPSDNFLPFLSIGRALDALKLGPLANAYRSLFNRISRHYHSDDADTWRARLERAGLVLDRWWPYFSRGALTALEWGHYLGFPALVSKKLTGRWVLWPSRVNLWATERLLRRYYDEPLPEAGAYLFFVAHKPAHDEQRSAEPNNQLGNRPRNWPTRS
jgi:SAM-dependent methyltransferase